MLEKMKTFCYLCKFFVIIVMTEVNFQAVNVSLPPLDVKAVQQWIEKVAASHDKRVGRLTYIFCDDEYIIATNRQYLGHDYYTDIITFDYSTRRRIAGDMVISLDTVRSNAAMLNVPYETELQRVVVHGVLHLCGINDKGPGEREIMERHENDALAMIDQPLILHKAENNEV
jgi:rRNA maturation RNase YbeY